MQDYKRIRIFQSSILESLSVVHPVVPAMIYIPLALYFSSQLHRGLMTVIIILLGFLCWTFLEYTMHRFVFHLPINTPWAKRISYIIHGIHHRDPKDPLRLVAPPILSISIGIVFYLCFSKIIPAAYFSEFALGFTLGYLSYDYLHWVLHHSRSKNKIIYYLRRNHALHHHSKKPQRFGVSSPLWDFIFNTYNRI